MSQAWVIDLGRVEYQQTADLQRITRDAREDSRVPDTLFVLEHEPVITTGHRTEPHEVAHALTTNVPIVATERGGKATYHGPGQIVVYPILALKDHGADIKAYVRSLEQAMIDTLGVFGIIATRRAEYPGVWVTTSGSMKKIGSIGVRVTRWVSFHGIALNVDCSLEPFTWFTPCGIPDVVMTSMENELGECVPTIDAVKAELVNQLSLQFSLEVEAMDRDAIEAVPA